MQKHDSTDLEDQVSPAIPNMALIDSPPVDEENMRRQ